MEPIIVEEKTKIHYSSYYVFSVILIVFLGYHFLISPTSNFPIGKIITVEQGASLRSLSRELKNQNVIRSRTVFESLAILDGGEKRILPGDYIFNEKISVFEVARRIVKVDRGIQEVKITIPEGFNINDIINTISPKLVNFDKNIFITLTKDKEGYLFPDTYFFFPSAKAEYVYKMMHDNFLKKINPLLSEINSSGKTLNQIITMASIVEGEAKGDSDRSVIAGILWNRINKSIPLQVDADMWTYKNKGLPDHPISNPGIETIKSAIHPTPSVYLFYLHDKNGNIHYAKTFAEHRANIKKYLTQ
ncbi:MAG: endolytic transglycosylase MltG [Candidatus Nomurabacteria bacterium]|nr:endolytic transglycosylase MltG [Candidatus Nomurabacteria bacterium]